MSVPPDVGSNVEGRIIGGGEPCILPQEYSFTVHCRKAHYAPVSGGGAEAGVKGGQAVVVSERL